MNSDETRIIAETLVLLMSSDTPQDRVAAVMSDVPPERVGSIAKAFIAAAWNADRGSTADRGERIQAWLTELFDAVDRSVERD